MKLDSFLDNKIFESANSLRNEILHLTIQNEKLRLEGVGQTGNSGSGSGDSRLQERIQQLEQKLLAQAEELTELHRRKGENAQQIIDLNATVLEKSKIIAARDAA